jgi:hypothetical protein
MDNLEKTVLYTNLKEYMIRTSIVFGLCEEKEIDTDQAYKKLIDIWNEYSEATIKIFESDNHEQ